MDSRDKIMSWPRAMESGGRVVTGYFDPIIPAQIERLRQIADGGTLVVLLKTPERACLDARARAELAASLAFVSAVVMEDVADGEIEAIPAHQEEARLRDQLLSLVRGKAAVKA